MSCVCSVALGWQHTHAGTQDRHLIAPAPCLAGSMPALVLALCSPLGMVNAVSTKATSAQTWRRVRRGAAERAGARRRDGGGRLRGRVHAGGPGRGVRRLHPRRARAQLPRRLGGHGRGRRAGRRLRPRRAREPAGAARERCADRPGAIMCASAGTISWRRVWPGRAREPASVRPAGRHSLHRRAVRCFNNLLPAQPFCSALLQT